MSLKKCCGTCKWWARLKIDDSDAVHLGACLYEDFPNLTYDYDGDDNCSCWKKKEDKQLNIFPLSEEMKALSVFDSNGDNVFVAYKSELNLRKKVIIKLAEWCEQADHGAIPNFGDAYNNVSLEQIIQLAVKETINQLPDWEKKEDKK